MSQFWFSLGFLSQNSLWKLLTFCRYKSIYSRIHKECEKSFFCKIWHFGNLVSWVGWVASLNREITTRPDYTFCPVMLQLLWAFCFLHVSHMWHFGELPVMSHSWDPVMRKLLNFFTLSHTQLLHNSHLITRYLIAEIQANLPQNKANTWLNKFNLTKRKFSKPKKFSTTKIININAKENLIQSTKFFQK